MDLNEFRSSLRAFAAELTGASPAVPVLVSEICKRLRVRIAKRDSVPEFKAYLSIDPSRDFPALILIPTKAIGNFERFCVAHELAHYYIARTFKITPETRSEYWKHESVCDDFARHLLIPDSYIMCRLARSFSEPTSYLRLCNEISATTKVPWMQAGVRISELSSNVTFFRCDRREDGEIRIASTTLARQK